MMNIQSSWPFYLDIFIGSLIKQIPFNQIKSRLLAMDPIFDDDQLLTNLIRFEPSDKEREALQNYINNPANQQSALSIPDQFCLEVCKSCKCMCEQGQTYAHALEKTISIDRYHERMETMLFKSMFRDKINHVEQVNALPLVRSRLIYVHILMYALRCSSNWQLYSRHQSL